MTARFAAIAAFLTLGLLVAPSATASSLTMSTAEYEAALSFIKETKEVMREAETTLTGPGITAEEATTRKTDLAARLDQLRRLMTHAAQRDRIGAKGKLTPERERARKIISEAGKIEDPLQDLWVIFSTLTRSPQRRNQEALTDFTNSMPRTVTPKSAASL